MKKFFKTIFYLIVLALAFSVSYIIFINVVKVHPSTETKVSESSSSDSTVSSSKKEEEEAKKVEFKLEDYPKVDASLGAQPLCSIFAEYFTGKDNIDDSYFNYSNTHQAYVNLIEGKKDLIIATEPTDEILEYAKKSNVELETIPVAKEALLFMVNSNNTISSLTKDQIQDIYSGRIVNWNKLSGPYDEIVAFQKPQNSGSYEAMVSLIMGNIELSSARVEEITDNQRNLIGLVSEYDNGMTSLGYSNYYYIKTMLEDVDSEGVNDIKILNIDGVTPTKETIKSGEYSLVTDFYIVIRKDEKDNSPVRTLANLMVSSEAQNLAEEVGYVGVK